MAIDKLQKSHDIWNEDNSVVKQQQDEINTQHRSAMIEIRDVLSKTTRLYRDCQKMISMFRKEYKTGFERIVRCEVMMKEVWHSHF